MRNEILPYERIRSLRTDRGLSQRQVAEMLGVKQNTCSQYEIGVLNYPIDVLINLTRFCNPGIYYLLNLTDDPAPYPRSRKK